MRSGEAAFLCHHAAYVFFYIVSMNYPVYVHTENVFYSEALDISEAINTVQTRTVGLKILLNADSDEGNGVDPNFKPRRRLLGQFSIPYFTLLNSSNTIYPDLAIRASDGSSLVPIL